MLRRLKNGLQEMEWELKFRMSQLPELCRIAGDAVGGVLKGIFLEFADKLDRKEVIDISGCFNSLISRSDLPGTVRKNMRQLGSVLGRYDLEAQLQGLELVRRQCGQDLKKLEENSEQRLRGYQTLAICAGAALAILLV